MKKFVPLILFVLTVSGISHAQITTRENDSTSYKIGARPVKGTKGVAVGVNLNDTTYSNFSIGGQGIMIIGKYHLTDRTVLRGSFRFNKDAKTTRGMEIDTSITNIGGQLVHDLKFSSREYGIMPGIERHFHPSNIFDIYVGAEALIGFRRKVAVINKDYTSDVYSHEKRTTPETLTGLSGIVGLNFFVADLPLSIGLEYNFLTIWSFGGKTHVIRETKDPAGVVNSDDYYTQEKDAEDNPDDFAYTKLKRNSVTSNDSFRIMLNFYFK